MRRKGPTRGNNRLIPTCLLAALLAGSLSVPRVSAQSAESYRQRAVELSRTKSWDEAIANYRKALVLEPKDATTHYHLAWLEDSSSPGVRRPGATMLKSKGLNQASR